MQGGGSTTEPGGIMEVSMLRFSMVPDYVVLVLGNEDGDPHHIQGCHTWGLGIGLR
jgi:hypothetical protein